MKKFLGFGLAALFTLSVSSAAFAAEGNKGNAVNGFFKRLFNYPVKAVKETGSMTANTLNNTGEKVLAKTGENTAAVLSGDVAKTGSLVADPVVGAAQTTGQTASETVQNPVKAAEEEKASEGTASN